jgi:hypothetical protein
LVLIVDTKTLSCRPSGSTMARTPDCATRHRFEHQGWLEAE